MFIRVQDELDRFLGTTSDIYIYSVPRELYSQGDRHLCRVLLNFPLVQCEKESSLCYPQTEILRNVNVQVSFFLHSKPSIDRNTSRVEINITGTVAQAVYPNYGPVIGTDKGDFGLHCGRDHI